MLVPDQETENICMSCRSTKLFTTPVPTKYEERNIRENIFII